MRRFITAAILLAMCLPGTAQAKKKPPAQEAQEETEDTSDAGERSNTVAELELGSVDQLDMSGEAKG